MMSAWRQAGRRAFTLVEIMIVVALIGLLTGLAIPRFLKHRKQSQGRRIVNDARIIDAAVDKWALELGKADGDPIDLASVALYTKGGVINPYDLLGNSYVFGPVGTNQVKVSPTTRTALAGVGVDWGAY